MKSKQPLTNAEKCRLYRAHRARRGLCIWSCGRKSARRSGLCNPCARLANERNLRNYYKRKRQAARKT